MDVDEVEGSGGDRREWKQVDQPKLSGSWECEWR
jgi:hypothetical protein